MLKKIISASAVAAALLLSGCGSNDAESELEIAQLLDDANYDAVIAKLGDINASKRTDSQHIALAAAYMGRSGLGMADLITVIADSSDASDDAFANFVNSVKEKRNSNTLSDLKKSAEAYYMVVDKADCSNKDANLSNTQKDMCLYSGLSETMKAASTLSYLGDFEAIIDTNTSSVTEDDSLKASACAMKYAFDGTTTTANCSPVEDLNVTFENNATYTPLVITMIDTGNTYDYLLTAPIAGVRQTALTDGYCTLTDFSTRDDNKTVIETQTSLTAYVCPVNENAPEEELTAADLVVEALNGGLDSVINSLVPEDTTDEDSDISADIEEFKGELLFADEEFTGDVTYTTDDTAGTMTATDTSGKVVTVDATFTTEDIINYLDSL